MSTVSELYNKWYSVVEDDLKQELESIKDDDAAINDRFYRELTFGTGGLRGVIGCGTNRMNIYTVSLAAQALALWLADKHPEGGTKVAIAYDSRNKSIDFAKATAATLAANGVEAYIFPQLEPTPVLSYAVRKLGCDAGVVITASHNPAAYNGFKCYGPDGCQMTDVAAHEVEHFMASCDIFNDVRRGDFDILLGDGKIKYIDYDLLESYIDEVVACSVEPEAMREAGLRLIYTPLFGAGCKPVCEMLRRVGIENVTLVEEQAMPNGDFPGLKKPNPELPQAFDEAIKLSKKNPADLLIATDPDSDRVGIAIPDGRKVELLTGNEVGALLLEYLLSRRSEKGTLSDRPVAVKSIVSTALADRICADYGCEMRGVLTGFKYIGEIITQLQDAGEVDRFVMGFEESYGYLTGCYARDKDAVLGTMLICEMASYYKLQGKSLLDVMDEIYKKYGYYRNSIYSAEFPGADGMEKMASIMQNARDNKFDEVAGAKVIGWSDYQEHVRFENGEQTAINLPASNVLEFRMEDGSVMIMRPSGTEPLVKVYFTAACETAALSDKRLAAMEKFARGILK